MEIEKIIEKTGALVVLSEVNRRYYTNFECSFGCVVLLEREKYLFTDFRYGISAKEVVTDCTVMITTATELYADVIKLLTEKGIKTVGYEDEYISVAEFKNFKKAFSDFELKPIGNGISYKRMIKSDDEINAIKKAQAVSETALTKTLSFLKAGITERDVRVELDYQLSLLGDGLAFDTIVAFGENSADCHHVPTSRQLTRGDLVLIDFGAKVNGYCSDMTRTFAFGEPDKKFVDLYSHVLSAQEYVLKYLKAGMSGKEADGLAREYFKANGYEKEFGHSLGHGVGLFIHEEPRLSQNSELILPENAVVTVEPGLYIEDFGGIRIEDIVVIKKDGIENLTNYPKSFII